MARIVWRGKTTKRLYQFSSFVLPGALIDANGAPLELATYNGEQVVMCNESGEIRRGVKGSPDPADPYGFGVTSSPWEQI